MRIALLAPLVVSTLLMGSATEGQETNIPKQTFQKYIDLCEELGQEIEIVVKKTEVVKRPEYENIPLDSDLLDYIWSLCQKRNIDYTLVLGLIKTESNYNPKVISYTGSSVGLFQINKNSYRWLAKEVNIKNPDLYNPYHSAKMGIFYLDYLRQHWLGKGYIKEEAMRRSLLSYNRGITGSKRYINQYGTSRSSYTKKIYENKNKIIKGDNIAK